MNVTVDGVYGPETEEAVRKFQAGQEVTATLAVDGIVGPETLRALQEAFDIAQS
jgi:N-acetylmuramoyl-L-alanine amidase